MDEKNILHILSLEHIFSSYYGHEKLNLKITKLLKIKEEEEENHFKISPEKLEYDCSLYDFEFGESSVFDVFINKDKIPILVFSKSNTINFMNLINHKIENCITMHVEKKDEYIFYVNQLKYYKYNDNEYILSLLNRYNQKLNIYDINNNFEIKFSISNNKEDNGIKNGFLFYYKNNVMLFLCFLKNVSIYNIHSKELITSIYKNKILSFDYSTFAEDFIYVDKNKSCYIIINSNEKMTSLKYPKCSIYKEYPNYFQEFGVYKYPRIFEFEDNKTYLFTIFNHDFLYVFDFHTSELIKEIDLITTLPEPVDACEYIFWNSDILLIPDDHDGVGSVMVNLSSENVETVLVNCYQMKKVFLPDSQESIIIKGFSTSLCIESLKKHYLSEEEKKNDEEKKEKEMKDYYDYNFLNNINLSDDE